MAAAAAGAATTDKQREAGSDDVELADLLPRRAPHLLQLLLLPLSHGDQNNATSFCEAL